MTLNGNNWTNISNNFSATLEAKVLTSSTTSSTNSEEYVYAYYPIECSYMEKASYLANLCPSAAGGFSKVVYASDGTNPQYDSSESFYIKDNLYDDDITELYDYTWSASTNIKVHNTSGGTCKATPVTKYDNGAAKNFVKATITRASSKVSALQNKLNAAQSSLTTQNNLLGYYTMLQNNLDIFGNFDYNN